MDGQPINNAIEGNRRRRLIANGRLLGLIAATAMLSLSACSQKDDDRANIPPSEPSRVEVLQRGYTGQELATGKSGRPLVVKGRAYGKDVTFLLDTNSTVTWFDDAYLNQMGAPTHFDTTETTGRFLDTTFYPPPQITIGERTVIPTGSIACHDFAELNAACGIAFDGLLGMDVLGQFVLDIDFDRGTVKLSSEAPAADSESWAVRIYYMSSIPHVVMDCGDRPVMFALDTGANESCIKHETFEQLAQTRHLIVGPSYAAVTPTGVVQARSGLLLVGELGIYSHHDLLMMEGPISLLGLTYLSRYKVSFDFPKGVATFTPGGRYHKNEHLGTSGLTPTRIDDNWIIARVKAGSPADTVVQKDDEILAVNDEVASDIDLFRMRELLTTGPDAPIRLRLNRRGVEVQAEFRTRDRMAR